MPEQTTVTTPTASSKTIKALAVSVLALIPQFMADNDVLIRQLDPRLRFVLQLLATAAAVFAVGNNRAGAEVLGKKLEEKIEALPKVSDVELIERMDRVRGGVEGEDPVYRYRVSSEYAPKQPCLVCGGVMRREPGQEGAWLCAKCGNTEPVE